MNIKEIEEITKVPQRVIRYLISENIIPKPNGTTKGAEYNEEHIKALNIYKSLKDQGVKSLKISKQHILNEQIQQPKLIIKPIDGIEITIDNNIANKINIIEFSNAIKTFITKKEI